MAPRWVDVVKARAIRHRLFGVRGGILLLLAGFVWCAAASLVRLVLLVLGLTGATDELAIEQAVLTFMPVADLGLAGLFIAVGLMALKPHRRLFPETATIACGLYIIYVVPYVFAFRHLTGTAAFSLRSGQTWFHYVVPVAFCAVAIVYLQLSRRVRVTYLSQLRDDDPQLDGAEPVRSAA